MDNNLHSIVNIFDYKLLVVSEIADSEIILCLHNNIEYPRIRVSNTPNYKCIFVSIDFVSIFENKSHPKRMIDTNWCYFEYPVKDMVNWTEYKNQFFDSFLIEPFSASIAMELKLIYE